MPDKVQYNVILMGDATRFASFSDHLVKVFHESGLPADLLKIHEVAGLEPEVVAKMCVEEEVAGVYFSEKGSLQHEEVVRQVVDTLARYSCLQFPVVHALENVQEEVRYDKLRCYNAIAYDSGELPSELFEDILKGFHIIHSSRKIFISYKRGDAENVAQALHKHLLLRGYQVFLDTKSLDSGVVFQERLMEHLHESDMVLLLQSPNIDSSQWITEEIIAAEVRGVFCVRLKWPQADGGNTGVEHTLSVEIPVHKLSTPGKDADLVEPSYEEVCEQIDRLRIKSLADRRRLLLHSMDFSKGVEIMPLDHALVVRDKEEKSATMFCPYLPDYQTLYRFSQGRETKNVHCLTLGYPEDRKKSFKWLCNNAQYGLQPEDEYEKAEQRYRVFLSAGAPEENGPDAANGRDVQIAVLFLVYMLVSRCTIVFGGHPSINPLVLKVAKELKMMDHIVIYQSAFFKDVIPEEVRELSGQNKVQWVPVDDSNDRAASLRRMREEMLSSKGAPFQAAFFISGKEGVREEYEMFGKLYPQAPRYMLVSTGGMAAKIGCKESPQQHVVIRSKAYRRLFTELLAKGFPREYSADELC